MEKVHSQAVLVVALSVALVAVALFAGVRLLAPRRVEPAADFAGLAVAVARRVEAYGTRHRSFQHLRLDSVFTAMPPGTGLEVTGDSTSATVVILHDKQVRCSVRLAYGKPLTQPQCTAP
jgi:hypothetical protein